MLRDSSNETKTNSKLILFEIHLEQNENVSANDIETQTQLKNDFIQLSTSFQSYIHDLKINCPLIYAEFEKANLDCKCNSLNNEKFETFIFDCILDLLENFELSKIMTANELLAYQKKVSLFISKAFNISIDISIATVRLNGCEKEQIKLLNRDKILKDFNIQDQNALTPIKLSPSIEANNCLICFDSFPPGEMFALPCQHYACTSCWKNHVINQKSSCPRTCFKCRYPLSDKIIESFVGESFFTNYSEEIISHQISYGKQFKRCISPKCDKIYDSRGVLHSVFECDCGTRVCWKCGKDAHAPLNCQQYEQFCQLSIDESLTLQTILQDSKHCIHCRVLIEKNGGCNHLICGNCKKAFCWRCGTHWNDQINACNDCTNRPEYEPKSQYMNQIPASDFLKFQNQFNGQSNREEIEKSKISPYLDQLKSRFLSEGQDETELNQLLKDIRLTILEARSVVKFSFLLFYFLKPDFPELKLAETKQKSVWDMLDDFVNHIEKPQNWTFGDYKQKRDIIKRKIIDFNQSAECMKF
jgi:ariadne-1